MTKHVYKLWSITLLISTSLIGLFQLVFHEYPYFWIVFPSLSISLLLSLWIDRRKPSWGALALFLNTLMISFGMYWLFHYDPRLTTLLYFPPLFTLLFQNRRYFIWSVLLTVFWHTFTHRGELDIQSHADFALIFLVYSLLLFFVMQNVSRSASEAAKWKERVDVLSKAIEARDSYTQGHSRRVALYAVEIGRHVPGVDIEELRVSGDLHDIGKIATPDSVLLKPGRLTPEEYEIIKRHSVDGANLLRQFGIGGPILDGVLYHHERMDGSGYPERLVGDQIPLFARILAVADTFDAMTTTRSYRVAFPPQKAYDEIVSLSGRFYDAEIVKIFCMVYPQILAVFEKEEGERMINTSSAG
ncbi:HD-GYP domain-containing protein [Tumebacillus sp. DT12]|uniref:HD-GYP domain-containing protein n=1 Tax=Tumebacillus lacus TaxID=2995335 RepID=A0ABT3X433_9BACL|nr:HD-GYP domain-containing protein [Tumebacillus lacus]MCX7571652.1 HD-GYP domain-containing protein [Tumebacillus lacus]